MESLEHRIVLDSTVVFSEIMYHPAAENEAQLEWIEFYNQLAVDMDVSDWSLEGGVDYKFPDGTVVPGRGHLVVAANPEALQDATGMLAAPLGPWDGQLSNGGEELRLYNNDNRLMNRVEYSDRGDWPVAPDGSGVTLVKGDRQANSELAENWTFSPQVGGTPGRENFVRPGDYLSETLLEESAPTRAFVPSDDSLGSSWTEADFDDSSWTTGMTGVGYDASSSRPYEPFLGLNVDEPPDGQPAISMRNINASVYIRVPFTLPANDAQYDQLILKMRFDDGFVAFLNGVEVAHDNAPGRDGNTEALSWDSSATRSNTSRGYEDFDISAHANLLRPGENVLAIHGMNTSLSSTDVLILPVLEGRIELAPVETSPIVINEVAPADAAEFFVEIANSGSTTVD